MGAIRMPLSDVVACWGGGAQIEVWADGAVWIADANGASRQPLLEWAQNDTRLDDLEDERRDRG